MALLVAILLVIVLAAFSYYFYTQRMLPSAVANVTLKQQKIDEKKSRYWFEWEPSKNGWDKTSSISYDWTIRKHDGTEYAGATIYSYTDDIPQPVEKGPYLIKVTAKNDWGHSTTTTAVGVV